jgi:hypothetical protein
MKIFCAAAVIALLAGPAYGQERLPKYGETDKAKSATEIQAEREAERAYKRSLGNIPEQKASDPWGNVRSDGAPKPVAKEPVAKESVAKGPVAKEPPAKRPKADSAAK